MFFDFISGEKEQLFFGKPNLKNKSTKFVVAKKCLTFFLRKHVFENQHCKQTLLEQKCIQKKIRTIEFLFDDTNRFFKAKKI